MAEVYDGFISYSHAADDLLAPRLQSALQRFAKPWWKRRAVRIFRDESSLSANPHLWSSITEALDTSGWFVLLLSPDAAQSEWVNQEIAYWVSNRDPKKILPVVTDGTFDWAIADVTGDAVPEALRGVFAEEPRWVDVRWAKDEDQLDLKDPRFADVIADIASTIRGIPKDDLASEEVRQHRRTVRTAWAAGGLVTVLAIAAVGFGIQSARNADEAQRQAEIASEQADIADANAELAEDNAADADAQRAAAEDASSLALARELAASAIAVLDSDPELATLLVLQAISATPPGVEQPVEVINALWRAGSTNRLRQVVDGDWESVAVQSEGGLVALGRYGDLSVFDPEDMTTPLWMFEEETSDYFAPPTFSPDGRLLAHAVTDSSTPLGDQGRNVAPDDLPARVIVHDVSSGSEVARLEFQGCPLVFYTSWSPDGSLLAVSPGPRLGGGQVCARPEASDGIWIELFETESWTSVAVIDATAADPNWDHPNPMFDQSGRLFFLGPFDVPQMYGGETFEPLDVFEGAEGAMAVSPDGSMLAAFTNRAGVEYSLYSTESGERVDRLASSNAFPSLPYGITFTPDGRYVVAATDGTDTSVWSVQDGERAFRLPGGPAFMTAFDPQLDRLYTADFDKKIRVWDLGPSGFGRTLLGDLGAFTWVNANTFSDNGAVAALDANAPGVGNGVIVFDPRTGSVISEIAESTTPVVLPDGRILVNRLPSHARIAVDLDSGVETLVFGCLDPDDPDSCAEAGGTWGEFYRARLSIDRDEIALVDREGFFTYVDSQTFEVTGSDRFSIDEAASDVLAFSHEFVVITTDVVTAAFSRVDGREIWRTEGYVAWGSETSPSGSMLAIHEPGVLHIVSLETWEDTALPIQFGRVRGLAFAPDEAYIAVGDEERLTIVDLERGEVVQSVAIGGVSDALWLDSERLIIGTNNDLWAEISLDVDRLVSEARETVLRTFTGEECLSYRIDPCPTLDELRGG